MTRSPSCLEYTHVDVFSPTPFGGNSLPVFLNCSGLTVSQMQRITNELRHFECIFLEPALGQNCVRARVFDLLEELSFAGHPVIGAAAVLHDASGKPDAQTWQFEFQRKSVSITTERTAHGFFGLLDQGQPEILGQTQERRLIASAFGLGESDLQPDLPLEVISTGLSYLIVPVQPGALGRARISADISRLLDGLGAQFAVLLDDAAVEIRHWNNDGVIEDVATGSAAGTVGAYRLRHGLIPGEETFVLHQGRFTGRPSRLQVRPEGTATEIHTVKVGGEVALVGRGSLAVPT